MALACNIPKGKGEWEMEKVKGLFKRFTTMFIALMCVLGMGTPVMAVDGNPNQIPTTPVPITIGGFDTSSQAKDIQIDAYQIISVNVDGSNQAANPLYIWNSDVAGWMKNNSYGNYVNTLDPNTESEVNYVADAFKSNAIGDSQTVVSQVEATKFYEELAAAIRKNNAGFSNITKYSKGFTDINGKTGQVTFAGANNGMPLGVYLVIVTGGIKTYQPTVVTLLPTYSEGSWTIVEENITVKSTNPAITKTVVENQTVAVGDVVKYKLDVTVPDYPINSENKTFTVKDKMPEGITYDSKTSVTVQYSDGTILNTSDKTYFKVTDVEQGNSGKGFMITFTDNYFEKYGHVTNLSITYQGTVVQAAFNENPDKLDNTATLTYNSDPYSNSDDYLKTATASARVYSYRMQINKVDKEGNPLAGAQFEIYKKTDAGTGDSENLLKFTGDKGNYILDASNTDGSVSALTVSDVTGEETKSGGSLLIKGLDVGIYIIKEVTAPEGYVLPDGQMEVTITDGNTLDGSIDSVSHNETGSFELYTKKDNDQTKDGVYITYTGAGSTLYNTVTIDILNTSNKDAAFKLPSTGGMGTILFTVGGLFVMAGAVVLAVYMYKKRNA